MRKLRWGEYFAIPVIVVLVTASLLFVPPPASAYTVPNNALLGQGGPSLTASLAVTVANTGDFIVVNVQSIAEVGTGGFVISTITDTFGDTFTNAVHNFRNTNNNCGTSSCLLADVWAASSLSSGSDTVLVTFNQTTAGTNMQLVDVAGLPAGSIIGTAIGTGTSSTFNAATSVPVATGNFADASIYNACDSSSSFAPGSGYTSNGGHASFNGDAEWGIPGSPPSSPTNFIAGCGVSTFFLEAGVVFGTAPPPVIVVIPCTAFQLQCWWYPFFFFGVYMILIVGMAVKAKVPKPDLLGLTLEAFSLASLLAVMLGIINIMFPLIITVVQVIRAIRE